MQIQLLSFVLLLIVYQLPIQGQIQLLNDEFNNAATLTNWQNISQSENWGFDQLEILDVNTSTAGRLHMQPYTSSWFAEYRGTLIFKELSGDFIVTTDVSATALDGVSLPGSQYSLAGMMMRTPLQYPNGGPIDWVPNAQDYVFLSIGFAATNHPTCPGCPGPHFEIKTTNNSNSNLAVSSISAQQAQIRMAKIGPAILILSQLPGQQWEVRGRYYRNDFPNTVQMGFVTYTDWPKVSTYTPQFHNENLLVPGVAEPNPNVPFNPDLIGAFDYARFDDVTVPTNLIGLDLTDPTQVTDADLLQFLGFISEPHCPSTFTVYDTISENTIVEVSAQDTIVATNLIQSNAIVIYHSGQEVSLESGFEVALGAEFDADIQDCN